MRIRLVDNRVVLVSHRPLRGIIYGLVLGVIKKNTKDAFLSLEHGMLSVTIDLNIQEF